MKKLFTTLSFIIAGYLVNAQNQNVKQLRLILESAKANFVNEVGDLVGNKEGTTIFKTKTQDEMGQSFIMDVLSEKANTTVRSYIIRYTKRTSNDEAMRSVYDSEFGIMGFVVKEKLAELAAQVKSGEFTTKEDTKTEGDAITDWFNKNDVLTVRFVNNGSVKTFIFYAINK